MIDRQVLATKVFRLTQGVQQLDGVDVVPDARVWIDILKRIDLERAAFLTGDYAACFIWRVLARLGDQQFQLFSR